MKSAMHNIFSRAPFLRISVFGFVILILSGCAAVGPDYSEPVIDTPDAWTQNVVQQLQTAPQSSLQSWWTVFNDPVLDDLIERSRAENLDLKIAVSRVRQSRAMLAMTSGEKLPTLSSSGTVGISQMSDDGPLEQVAPAGGFSSQEFYEIGVDSAWEIDVFGGIRRSIEAAGAGYQASIEDYRDVLATMYAEVALVYVDIRALQQRIFYMQENAGFQRNSLDLAQDRFDSGVSSRLDVAQAQASLSSTLASIPSLEISLNHALNRLAVLLGQDAGSLQAEFSDTRDLPIPAQSLGIGVPANVLRQRPDIRQAERLLAAQTAQIGVATADLYPRFGLGGFFGLQSTSLSNLLDSSSITWGLNSPIQWDIFNGGRVRSNIQMQDEIAQQRLLQYEQKVLSAVEEVENAIVAYNLGKLVQQHLEDSTTATLQAEELVLVQYNTGLTDFNNVLVTQRDLSSQQDRLVVARAQILVDLIALYKALGGGWDVDQPLETSGD
jgi:NodT family efflux transporter outer membrane factor (OMF) lipoprotein